MHDDREPRWRAGVLHRHLTAADPDNQC